VKEAVEEGKIAESRYINYLQMLEEHDGDIHRRSDYA
jgi:putative ribosome biogenesis GTPase RsgA